MGIIIKKLLAYNALSFETNFILFYSNFCRRRGRVVKALAHGRGLVMALMAISRDLDTCPNKNFLSFLFS